MKTDEQLKVVASSNERILVETDCPWCAIRPSHAGSEFIKTKWLTTKKKDKSTKETLIDGRYEPAQILPAVKMKICTHVDDQLLF